MRRIELALILSGFTERLHPVAVLVKLSDSRIDISIADEDVALRVPRDVCRLPELSVNRRSWRVHASPWAGFVGCFFLSAEHHHNASFRIELDDHVGALVHGPEVVVLIDAYGMREGPGIEILSDLSDVLTVRSEFEDLRGGCAVCRPGCVAAVENKNVSLRVHCHARGFAEMQIRWELEDVGNRVEWDFGNRLLSENCRDDRQQQCDDKTSHVVSLVTYVRNHKDTGAIRGTDNEIKRRISMSVPRLLRSLCVSVSLWFP